jgi:hypothetical protein
MSKKDKEKEDNFLMLPNNILALRQVKSKTIVGVDGSYVLVDVTAQDKIIYTYMKKRFSFFKATKKDNKKGSSYYDKQKDIAIACGVDVKTVQRVVSKWLEHGYIESIKGYGNRVNYTKMLDWIAGESVKPEIPEYLSIAPPDFDMLVPDNDYNNDEAMSMFYGDVNGL